jgi:quinol monooxygenase YgiN
VNLSEVEKEPGTLAYILHEDAKEEDVLWFYEVYSDQDAFKAHGSAEWMKALGPKLAPLMGGRPELIFLNPVGGKGLA